MLDLGVGTLLLLEGQQPILDEVIGLVNHIGFNAHQLTRLQFNLPADFFVPLAVRFKVECLMVVVEVILLVVKEVVVHLLIYHLALHVLGDLGSKVGKLDEGHEGVIRRPDIRVVTPGRVLGGVGDTLD